MNTCVAAHAVNGLGSGIMLILPNNDAVCDLCDLRSAACKISCSCSKKHAVKALGNGDSASRICSLDINS
jgi:hypothetical protein